MSARHTVASLLLCLLTLTPSAHAAPNAGIVEGLWYAREPAFAGEANRIYVAIRNSSGSDLLGVVEFFEDGERIGRREVSVLDGRIIETWADWTPRYGEHELSVSLTRVVLDHVGGESERVEVTSAIAADTRFIDRDTDGDGEGDALDPDDDNDRVSDEVEAAQGTDPLVPNPPEAAAAVDVDTDENHATSDAATSTTGTAPQGLERYLSDNRADTFFGTLTDTINDTRALLDDYRARRSAATSDTAVATASSSATSSEASTARVMTTDGALDFTAGSFGEPVRSASDAPPRGAWTAVGDFFIRQLSALFTFVLFLASTALAAPALLELALLILILIAIFRIAQRLAARP